MLAAVAVLVTSGVAAAQPKPSFRDHYESVQSKLFVEMDLFCAKLQVRESEKEANRMSSNIIYNLHGNNPRVNINSQDYSINIANSKVLFDEMRKTIEAEVQDKNLAPSLLQKVTELEENVGKRTFLQKYSEFVALAANHMKVFGPFVPALTQYLEGEVS